MLLIATMAVTFLLSVLPAAASPLPSALAALAAYHGPSTLNITSLGHQDGVTTLECWQLDNPFQTTSQTGVPGTLQLQLGDITNMSYTVVPPRYFPPAHNAPIIQYGMFLTGLAHITLPSGKNEVYIKGGIKQGLVIDTDVAANSRDGHTTAYPSDKETILMQIPIKDGIIPPHKVIHDGPCTTMNQQV